MAENNSSAPLLPCPFCGGPAGFKDGAGWHGAGCIDLPCPGYPIALAETSPAKAAASWNTRAPQAVAAQAPAAVMSPHAVRDYISNHIADNWPMKRRFSLEEIVERVSAIEISRSATPALSATEDSSADDLARHGMTPRDKGTQDQIAAVMLQHGTPEQQLQALATCCNVSPDSIKAMVAAAQAEVQAEPVMIYHGRCTIDCGAHGHHDVEMLKMIPAGAKLYTAPQAQPADAIYEPMTPVQIMHAERARRDLWDSINGPLDWLHLPEQDASRYRYLRARDVNAIDSGGVFAGMTPENVVLNGEDLDAAIDAAMAAAQEGGK